MLRLDLYDVTFKWSDDSEMSHSYRAEDFHTALTEAMDDDDDAMSPTDENAELLTVLIHNNSAAGRHGQS